MKKHYKNVSHKDIKTKNDKFNEKITNIAIFFGSIGAFCLGLLSLYYPLIGTIYIFTSLIITLYNYLFNKEYKQRLLDK